MLLSTETVTNEFTKIKLIAVPNSHGFTVNILDFWKKNPNVSYEKIAKIDTRVTPWKILFIFVLYPEGIFFLIQLVTKSASFFSINKNRFEMELNLLF